MKVPQDRISRVALIIVGILCLMQIFYLISQLIRGTRMDLSSPSYLALVFSVFISVAFLVFFWVWRERWPYLMLALFFLWFSITLKKIAGFIVADERFLVELAVTIVRIIMCILLLIGVQKGELGSYLNRSGNGSIST